jgi:hypothetical protein
MRKFIYFLLLVGCGFLVWGVWATVPVSHTVGEIRPAKKPTVPLAEQLIKAEQNINTPRPIIPIHPPVVEKKIPRQAVPEEVINKTKILILRLAKLTQNIDNPRASSIYLWNRRLGVSGLLNLDSNYQNSYNFTRRKANHGMISVAKLNFDLDINSWLHAHLGLFASSENNRYYPVNFKAKRIEADEAYLTIANLSKSAFYVRLGKQYLPFGNYHRYPIFKTLTQQLSETRGNAAQVGYLDYHGIYYAVYAFNGATRLSIANRRDNGFNNGGATLGYINLNNPVGVDVGIDYYQNRVAGVSLHADLMTGPFNFAARFVTACERFNPRDFAYQTNTRIIGAKPNATSITAGYRFKTKGRDSKFVLSYQWSGEAYNMSNNSTMFTRLPKRRISMAYGVRFCPHLILGVEFTRDRDYALKHGGTNRFNNTISARASAYI